MYDAVHLMNVASCLMAIKDDLETQALNATYEADVMDANELGESLEWLRIEITTAIQRLYSVVDLL